MIVPVWLTHVDDPQKETLVYAILDNQSDTSFILKKTADELNLPATDVTLLLSTMLAENQPVSSSRIHGLSVRGFYSGEVIDLPTVYTRNIMPANRDHIPSPEMTREWPHLHSLYKIPPVQDVDIALLLGINVRKVLEPLGVLRSKSSDGPFGQRSVLGWGIIGMITDAGEMDEIGYSHVVTRLPFDHQSGIGISPQSRIVLRTKVKEVTPDRVLKVLQTDFCETINSTPEKVSQEDKRFLQILRSGIKKTDGHYQMPLPFKEKCPHLPSNRGLALKRLQQLKRKLRSNPQFKNHYDTFMRELLAKGYAEKAEPLSEKSGFYIPHHGVYNVNKPGKVRVVFDCSAKMAGSASLNDCLLQGPDLTNSLVGVLCRFRLGPVAFLCDIEKMFYQFKVEEEYRDFLRFFWWEDGNIDTEPLEYRMTVHLFGASSSPGCSNFGLKQTAIDNAEKYGNIAAEFLHSDFYVDDGLKSCESASEAIDLVRTSVAMCAEGGLRLHKFVSNNKDVLSAIPEQNRAANSTLHCIPSLHNIERALGIQWCIQSDSFQYRIILKERPPTRRGILSSISSVYDPLGFLAPFILIGKQLLQDLCRNELDWDSEVPTDVLNRWTQWKADALHLDEFSLNRCLRPKEFGKPVYYELHHFADASSSTGYGTCSYLRQINTDGQVHVAFLMGKSRVIPLKRMTVPRLELTAAVVAINIDKFLVRELKLGQVQSFFWTDSKVVLAYIANTTKRFHVYVANRIEQIRAHSTPEQWHHIAGKQSPADIASRGMAATNLVRSELWYQGPEFLWTITFPITPRVVFNVRDDDPEVKKSIVHVNRAQEVFETSRFNHISDWHHLKRAIALCLKFKEYLRARVRAKRNGTKIKFEKPVVDSITTEDLERAAIEIIKNIQKMAFGNLKPGMKVGKKSPLYRLDVSVDESSIIRVGGRLTRSKLSHELQHPVILPKSSHVTDLVIQYYHDRYHHQGKGITLNALRTNGFWIINGASLVGQAIGKCVLCRKVRASPQVQKMADLPRDRCEEAAPFSYAAVDFSGPFYVKEGRRTLKRYGCLFTCLVSRGVHIEVAHSLSTDSFINALRRLINIRGPVKMLRCDRGTNFVGADNELRECSTTMRSPALKQFLLKHGGDIHFEFNPPHASHFGGVYERMIRSTRNILNVLLERHGTQLDDESLQTFMCEVAGVINSRPLTTDTLNDPHSLEPLTPNHIILMKSNVILPPPGEFVRQDIYLRKRWKRVQYLLEQFWSRWKIEYLTHLQARSKWNKPQRNLAIGDIVLVKEPESPRNEWKLARVIEVKSSKDSLVRSVRILLADRTLDKFGRRVNKATELERPIHKLVLLLPNETG